MVLRKTEKEGSGLSRPPFAGHHGRVPATPKEMEFHNCVIFFCPSPFPSVPPSSCLRHPPSVILPPSSSLPPCLPPSTHSFTYHNIYIYLFIYMAYMANHHHHHHHHHHHPLSFSTLTVRRWRGPPAILAGPPAPKGLQPNLDPSKRAKVES